MIQQRTPNSWSADQTVTLNTAHDTQSLLDAVVARYGLLGAVLANEAGEVFARTGSAVSDLKDLAAAIDPRVLPRYYANGPFDAYVDIVGANMIALVMRERPESEPRTELTMVSDYAVAKDMMQELRTQIARIAGGSSS